MAYERITITYEVVWKALMTGTDRYGLPCPITMDCVDCETEREAEQVLADAGYTRFTVENPRPFTGEVGWFEGSYRRGQIIRFLKEVK